MQTNQHTFDELKVTGALPSPTGAALRILELARQENAALGDIATILKSDPALAGKVLRAVNSAQMGLVKPTADLLYGVSLLGLRAVRRLALAFSVAANSPRGVCHGFDYDDFWRHSLAAALTSQSIGAATRIVEPEEAYSCGLLSQIGRLGLATVHPEIYASLLGEVPECDLAAAEQEAFGIDHNHLTAAMLADWGLPDVLVEASLHHEDPDSGELPEGSAAHDMAHVLHFASYLADTLLVGRSRPQPISSLLESAQRYQLTPDAVVGIAEEAMENWKDWCSLLEIEPSEIVPLATTMQALEKSGSEVESPAAALSTDSLRILVVDDDEMSLRCTERHLSTAGHELVTVRSAADALRVVLEFNPHVLITDWMMPEMDGLELCRTLRQSDMGRHVYVIILTCHEDKHRLSEAFAAGCDDFLTRPVHPQELWARTRAASRVLRLQAELAREKSEVQEC